MKNNSATIGIIGIGAIGSYFASKMKLSGFDPILFINEDAGSLLKIIYRENGRIYQNQFNIGHPLINNKFDFLFITVKSYHLSSVIKNYKSIIDNSKRIILVQSNFNLGSYNWGNNINKLYFAPLMIGVLGDYHSIIYELNKGYILLGKVNNNGNNDINSVKNILSNITETIISDNIEFDLFMKIILNTSLFPLSILNSCTFGKIYVKNVNIHFASKIFYECISIARGHFGKQNLSIDSFKLDSITPSESLYIIKEKITKYSSIFPSVLLDLLKEKKETELKYFYDDIIVLAEKYKINIPYTKQAREILYCFCAKNFYFNLIDIDEIIKNYRQQCI